MTNVVRIRPKEPPAQDNNDLIIEALAVMSERLIEALERIDRIEARLPAPPIVLSENWITIKAAAFDFGLPEKTVSRWALGGLIESVKLNGKRAINRVDLERHLALRH